MNLYMPIAAVLGALCIGAIPANAQTVDDVLAVGESKNLAAKRSQKKIDVLAEQTGTLFQEYRTTNKQIESLRIYNQRLEKQIENQLQRIEEIDYSIDQVTVIQRQITPLIVHMIDGLDQFVHLDIPFHLEEREERIAFLRANIDRSDLSVSEKFRQVLEAYKIENEYGRKIDTYKGTIDIDGISREVNFFRVGRIALMYQTTDQKVSGAWDKSKGQFVRLDNSEYRSAIQNGLRMAREQTSVDILKVPVSFAEGGQS